MECGKRLRVKIVKIKKCYVEYELDEKRGNEDEDMYYQKKNITGTRRTWSNYKAEDDQRRIIRWQEEIRYLKS